MIRLTSLMSPLLGVGVEVSEVVVETLVVRRSLGLCLITSLLLTSGPLRSAISDADFTANRDEASPPDWVRLREGEWLEFADTPREGSAWCDAASVLCSAMEGDEC